MIWNKEAVNIWNDKKLKSNVYIIHENIFRDFLHCEYICKKINFGAGMWSVAEHYRTFQKILLQFLIFELKSFMTFQFHLL